MDIALDGCLLLFFAVVVLIYTFRGLFASLWGAARAIVSFVAAYFFGVPAGEIIYKYIISERMNKPVLARLLSEILGCISVFFACFLIMLVVGIIAKSRIRKIPVFNTVNHILGFCFGIVAGVVYVWVICWIISFLVEKHLAGSSTEYVRIIAENSFIFRFFCNLSPLEYINIVLPKNTQGN